MWWVTRALPPRPTAQTAFSRSLSRSLCDVRYMIYRQRVIMWHARPAVRSASSI